MISLRRVGAVLRKELLQLRRDRMTFGMVVMIPLVQLLLFGYAINTNIRGIPVGVVDDAQSGLSRALVQMVQATQVVEVTQQFTTAAEAESAIRAGTIRAALLIPDDLAGRVVRASGTRTMPPPATSGPTARPVAQWLVDGADTTIAATMKGLRNMPLGELSRQRVNAPVPTFEVTLFYNPEQRSEVNIVPGLVGVILTMTMIMFTSASIVRETERGNMEMLITTPIRPIELMIAKVLPFLAIGLVQVGIILGLGHLVFDVPINGQMGMLLLVVLAFIAASLSLGLVMSTIAKSQLQAMQMTVFVLLPSILLSGFMFPFDGMPPVAQAIAQALPATHFMTLIRGVVLRDAGVMELLPGLLWLSGFTLIFMTLASLRFRKRLD